jgi:hypothetical protein
MKRMLSFSAGILLAAGISTSLYADPPERVARLNYIQGDVTFRPAGLDDWTDASVNRPMIADDELWTDLDSRAELHLGSAALRVGPLTAFSFLALDDHLAQIRLSQGTLDVRVRHLDDEDTFEIDAPNLSLSVLRPGNYRVSVSADGQRTDVTLRSGEMEATAEGGAFAIHPHEMVTIEGYGGDQRRRVADMLQPDPFDRWCSDRDARDDRAAERTHVPREVIGYEDLADYGVWEQSPAYGWVWAPRAVAVSWAPYHDGHWAWIAPWGWTWVDDAPWGFAPFHYGRWASVRSRWVWVPGAVVHPVYAPALVAFVGGARWSASISFGGGGGGVAWFPLAPGEVYVPSYRVRPEYVRALNAPVVNVTNINVTNINVTNIHYANQNVQGAVTAVSRDDFTHARPVARAAVAVNVQALAAVQVAGTTAPVAPQAASVLGRPASAPAHIARMPVAAFTRPVVAKTSPPPPPVPFAAQQQVLAAHPGQALEPAEVQKIRPAISMQPKVAVRPALATGFVVPKGVGPQPKTDLAKPTEAVVSRPTLNANPPKAAVYPTTTTTGTTQQPRLDTTKTGQVAHPPLNTNPPNTAVPTATSGSVVPREITHQPRLDTAKSGEAAVSHTPANVNPSGAPAHPATTTAAVTTTSVTTTSAPRLVGQPPRREMTTTSHTSVTTTTTPTTFVPPPQPVPPTGPGHERVEHAPPPPPPVVKQAPPPVTQTIKPAVAVEPPKKEVKTEEKKSPPPDKKKDEKKDPAKKDEQKKDDHDH